MCMKFILIGKSLEKYYDMSIFNLVGFMCIKIEL